MASFLAALPLQLPTELTAHFRLTCTAMYQPIVRAPTPSRFIALARILQRVKVATVPGLDSDNLDFVLAVHQFSTPTAMKLPDFVLLTK